VGESSATQGPTPTRADDLAAIEQELDVARQRDDNAARVRLIVRALELPQAQPYRPEYLDELAYAYEQLGRFDEAIHAMRGVVAAGWDGEIDDHPSAQALIADLLLRAGRTEEAAEAWLEAERHDPADPNVAAAAGRAYAAAGLYEQAHRCRQGASSWRLGPQRHTVS
jgi:tetratricopeptide (TPR) repeat protein